MVGGQSRRWQRRASPLDASLLLAKLLKTRLRVPNDDIRVSSIAWNARQWRLQGRRALPEPQAMVWFHPLVKVRL